MPDSPRAGSSTRLVFYISRPAPQFVERHYFVVDFNRKKKVRNCVLQNGRREPGSWSKNIEKRIRYNSGLRLLWPAIFLRRVEMKNITFTIAVIILVTAGGYGGWYSNSRIGRKSNNSVVC